MVTVIPEHLKKLWDEWNLRASILFSLVLQMFLIFSATSRKRKGPGKLMVMVWLAYLLADWIAAYAVGLISNGMGNDCPNDFNVSKNVAAFWAPFLLLHLGGPDTITAFSLEDNALWIRHLFGLCIQFFAVLYVFLQSLPNDFWIPTLLVLIAGTIKYVERTRALYVACLSNFKDSLLPKPDAGPNYAQLMEEYASQYAANNPVEIDIVRETDKGLTNRSKSGEEIPNLESPTKVVCNAFKFYRIFRGLIVDHMLSFQERDESREFFFQRSTDDAFRVMEAELNFIYDELYTKMAVVHHTKWHFLRIICSVFVAISLQQFACHQKHNIHRIDIGITYTLLIGALVLEIISHFKLVVSDWSLVVLDKKWLKKMKAETIVSSLRELFSFSKKRHWSNTISRHSLIYYCLDQRVKWIDKIIRHSGLKDVLDEWRYKRSDRLDQSLKDFIFEELRRKAKNAEAIKSAKEIYSTRGEYTLLDYPCQYGCKFIARSVSEEVEFDESLLLWHIATELCYYGRTNDGANLNRNGDSPTHGDPHRNDDRTNDGEPPNRNEESTNDDDRYKRLCKLLSEYMLYLLIMRPTEMSAVAGIAQIRFQDTCEEVNKFFSRDRPKLMHLIWSALKSFVQFVTGFICPNFTKSSSTSDSEAKDEQTEAYSTNFKESSNGSDSEFKEERSEACSKLLKVNTVVKGIVIEPSEVKGDRSKSLLFDACILAKELQELDSSKRWEMMSKVWVELLCYAASHCRASSHAQLLSKGGELITFVWLLMAHFGLGDQFRIQAGDARVKLIVSK